MRRRKTAADFDHYIDEYLYFCQSRRLRPKTMQSYEQTLRLFERWAREQEQIESPLEVREQTIRHYICELQERGKYSFCARDETKGSDCPEHRRDYCEQMSITTINNYIRNLRAFFNWFAEETSMKDCPMRRIRLLENERKAREYLEDEEVRRLLNSFEKARFSEYRDVVATALILDTGMRLRECLLLKGDQIDLTECTVTLSAEITKGRKSRTVFFSAKTAKLLRSWLRFKDRYATTEYLFPVKSTGEPVENGTFETNFKRYIARAGIEKDISPHALRNNFAKRCLMNGMDIYTLSRILGHSSVTITEQAYLDLTDTDLRRRYQQFSPLAALR